MEYVLSRSEGDVVPLSGKRVVVIGCGAIGGYLAYAVAQLGAGFGGGSLLLIDPETLAAANIARHILGADSVGKGKAEQCKLLITKSFPEHLVISLMGQAQQWRARIMAADLLVDATGEQGVSEMINDWSVSLKGTDRPMLLHSWLEGHGAAVRSFVSTDLEFGCYRCLRPHHEDPPRFGAIREGAPTDLIGGCGESPFAPYGPAAPMMAAALAAQHISDWAKGKQRPLLRTIRLNWDATVQAKPSNPTRAVQCPACG